MARQIILTTAFLSFVAAFAAAQDLTVTYLDGTLEVRTAKGWRTLDVGSTIKADSRVRVGDSGSVELRRGSQHISIIQDGEYAIAELLSSSGKAGSKGVGVTLASKLHSVASGTGRNANAVGGVRGAAQGDNSQDLTWMGTDDEDTSAKAQALLDKQRYREAETELARALTNAQDDQKKQDLEYLLASAYYGDGESARAYHTLLSVKNNIASTYYPDSVILKAQILLDNGAFADSLKILKDFQTENTDNRYVQISHLLSAQCYKELGDTKSEKDSLQKGYAIDPRSDTAQQISKLQNE